MLTRRNLLLGLGASACGIIAAPAIVRASSLMPVRAWLEPATSADEVMQKLFDLIWNDPVVAKLREDFWVNGTCALEMHNDGTIRRVPPTEWLRP